MTSAEIRLHSLPASPRSLLPTHSCSQPPAATTTASAVGAGAELLRRIVSAAIAATVAVVGTMTTFSRLIIIYLYQIYRI